MAQNNHNQGLNDRYVLANKLDSIGWGLFFIWVGIAMFGNLDWGTGLLGVGIVTIGGQALRKYFGLRIEAFWIVVGIFFALGGVWEIFNVQFGILPFLCIAGGITLLVSKSAGKSADSIWCRRRETLP